MRAETRFVGKGNTWVGNGHYRGWKISCSKCGAVKTITSHNGSSIPPNVIVKKLTKLGWHLGNDPAEDLCIGCVKLKKTKKPPPVPIIPITTILPDEYFRQLKFCLESAQNAVRAKNNGRAEEFINTAIRGLTLSDEVMATVKRGAQPVVTPSNDVAVPQQESKLAAKPKKRTPKPKPKSKPAATSPVEDDSDYRKWLSELCKEGQE
ncbi:hypothetical protein ABIF78_007666 [Bradyrhizobium japonicum]